jgi:hypothetical protein
MIVKLFDKEKDRLHKMNQEVKVLDLFLNFSDYKESYGESNCAEKKKQSFTRLTKHIDLIIKIANQYHADRHFTKSKKSILMKKSYLNSITRISLSEFSLYTNHSPLSLKCFSLLINKIEAMAKASHENLHILLSTVPVKIQNNEFVNYAIYVQCGPFPVINTFAKTCIALEDITYKNLNIFDRADVSNRSKSNESIMASLPLSHNDSAISQQPMIKARTVGGAEFLVLIDICLEHKARRAKKIFCHALQSSLHGRSSDYISTQVNHVITSNSINFTRKSMITLAVTHADSSNGKVSVASSKEITGRINPKIKIGKYNRLIKTKYPNVHLSRCSNGIYVQNPPFGPGYTIGIYSKYSLSKYGLNKYFSEKVNRLNNIKAWDRALTLFKNNKNNEVEPDCQQFDSKVLRLING